MYQILALNKYFIVSYQFNNEDPIIYRLARVLYLYFTVSTKKHNATNGSDRSLQPILPKAHLRSHQITIYFRNENTLPYHPSK